MALASSRVRRLEREAILRTKVKEICCSLLFNSSSSSFERKEFDHKREQSSYLLTNDYRDAEDDENDRHRRFDIIRQTRQIQREIDHQVGAIEKRNERKKQELEKKLNSPLNRKSIDLLGLNIH